MLASLIGPYITRALGGLLLAVSLFAGWQYIRADTLKAKLDACIARREQLLTDVALLKEVGEAYRKQADDAAQAAQDARTDAIRNSGRASALAEQLRARKPSGACSTEHLKGLDL